MDTAAGDVPELFSEEELRQLVRALARGQGFFTEHDLDRVLDWAHLARVGAQFLEWVLAGEMCLRLPADDPDGEPVFDLGPGPISDEATRCRRPEGQARAPLDRSC